MIKINGIRFPQSDMDYSFSREKKGVTLADGTSVEGKIPTRTIDVILGAVSQSELEALRVIFQSRMWSIPLKKNTCSTTGMRSHRDFGAIPPTSFGFIDADLTAEITGGYLSMNGSLYFEIPQEIYYVCVRGASGEVGIYSNGSDGDIDPVSNIAVSVSSSLLRLQHTASTTSTDLLIIGDNTEAGKIIALGYTQLGRRYPKIPLVNVVDTQRGYDADVLPTLLNVSDLTNEKYRVTLRFEEVDVL